MKRLIVLAATAAALLAPSAASAQSPDRTVELSQTAPLATWEGEKTSGAGALYLAAASRCTGQDPYKCDETLINVTGGPTPLALETIKQKGQDFDLYVYESNAQGTQLAPAGASLEEGDVAEKVIVDAAEGYYLAVIHYWAVENAAAQGKATLTKFAAAAPKPAPAPEPTPAPSPGSPGAPGQPAGPGQPAAFDFGAGFGKAKLKPAFSKGFPVTLRCSTACKGTAQLSIDARTAKKFKLGKKAFVVAKATFDRPAGTHGIFMKLTAKAKKRLAKAKSLKLVLSATATSGSVSKSVTAKGSFKR